MWVDPSVRNLDLTAAEGFLLGAWSNMVHQYSLDSYRVRTMNPHSITHELLHMLDFQGAKDSEQQMVIREAAAILREDPALKREYFSRCRSALTEQLAKWKPKTDSRMIAHFARELAGLLEEGYLRESCAEMSDRVTKDPFDKDDLATLTSNLLSTLIYRGGSLESAFQIYRQFLARRQPNRPYDITRKIDLVRRIVTQPRVDFRLLFAMDNLTSTLDFPESLGDIRFYRTGEAWPATAQPPARQGQVAAYLQANPRRLFAELTVSAQDVRTAGTEGYSKIANVLDLVRFEHERERVALSEQFLVHRGERTRLYSIPSIVPNPFPRSPRQELASFVESVNELLSSSSFTEGRDRVLSAFRLYRVGADTNVFANKITNWWTAVEFLVRGVKGEQSIGVAVESSLAPVLCLDYIPARLLEMQRTCGQLSVQLAHGAAQIDWKSASVSDVFQAVTAQGALQQLEHGLQAHSYVHFRYRELCSGLGSAAHIKKLILDHEHRVRWQLQRIWRARCDIVHSAKRPASEALLAANLESYLKVTLMSLLAELRTVKTLSSPEEFFARRALRYEHVMEHLGEGNLGAFVQALSDPR